MNHTDVHWTEEHQANSEPDFYGKWIDAQSSPPPLNHQVLISDGKDTVGHARRVSSDYYQVVSSNTPVINSAVVYWMEKPKPGKD